MNCALKTVMINVDTSIKSSCAKSRQQVALVDLYRKTLDCIHMFEELRKLSSLREIKRIIRDELRVIVS